MSKRIAFRLAFLTVTLAAIGLELFAAFDGSPETEPWTDLITSAIPAELTFTAIGALALWLTIHFGLRYWRKHKTDKENR